ncbi:carbohydrate ABC transporter permease [[Eubacterium] cellulosolvens]
MKSISIDKILSNITRSLVIIGTLIFALFPIYWALSMSFKPADEWAPSTTHWWPWNPTINNYLPLFFPRETLIDWGTIIGWQMAFPETAVKAITNSLVLGIGGTILSMFIGTTAAYAMSRYRAGGNVMPYMFLTFRMLPPIAIMIPVVVWFSTLRLMDTHHGMFLLYGLFPVPFVIWLMKSFFDEIPKEIDEAALIDGCTPASTFIRVVLPLVRAGLAVTALFIFILNWSELMVALSITRRNAITIPVQIGLYSTDAGFLYGVMAALGMIAIIPTLVFGLAIQRYLVRGFTFGAIKG